LKEVNVTNAKLASVVAALAFGAIGCASSAPAPEVPSSEATSSTEVAATPPAEAAPVAPAVPAAPAAPVVAAAPALTGEQLDAWYQQCWAQFNEAKWDEFSKCYAENAVAHEAGNPKAYEGRASVIEGTAKNIKTAFPDGKGELQLTLVNGKNIAAVALFTGTHTGVLKTPMGEVAPTNKKIGMRIAHYIQLDANNKVAKQWFIMDAPTMMAQLGKGMPGAKARKAITKAETPVVIIAKNDDAEKALVAEQNKTYALLSAHDKAGFDLIADDVVDDNAAAHADTKGKAAYKKTIEGYWKAFSDLKFENDSVWAAGNYTFSVSHFRGTNDGAAPALGIAKKTDKPLDVPYVEFVEWKDGKMAKLEPFYNSIEMAVQLDLLPKPKPEKAPATTAAPAGEKPAATAATPAAKNAEPAAAAKTEAAKKPTTTTAAK
jgi:predicted ester cyclase